MNRPSATVWTTTRRAPGALVGTLLLGCGAPVPGQEANGRATDPIMVPATDDEGAVDDSDTDGLRLDVANDGLRLDVANDGQALPPEECIDDSDGDGDGVVLSYIWIANTLQGTVSKIDTRTLVEHGRYQTGRSGASPSRTSVNLAGDVAVANRNGGVAKFWADVCRCTESDGTPGIQSSTGSEDILPFGEDECLAWYADLDCSNNRPVAWTPGEVDDSGARTGGDVWTVCDDHALLLDGDSGAILGEVALEPDAWVYGGAVDGVGNFWGLDRRADRLLRIDIETFTARPFALENGGYGITVGPSGRPWVCGGGGVSRFDVATATWTHSTPPATAAGGCMTDGVSRIWHSDGAGMLRGFDLESLELVQQVQLPEYAHGVSVDFEGYLWGVAYMGKNAYRADPLSGAIETFDGLVGAYTYSDMTGFALRTAGTVTPEG